MLRKLFDTKAGWEMTLIRFGLATVFFPHGAQKVLGWWGGYGLAGTYGYFTDNMGIPGFFAACAIAAEFLGPIALFSGLLTRVAAFGIGTNMVVAVVLVHWPNGFFMNWAGKMPAGTEGFEFHILAIAMALGLMVAGGGRFSLDRLIAKKIRGG